MCHPPPCTLRQGQRLQPFQWCTSAFRHSPPCRLPSRVGSGPKRRERHPRTQRRAFRGWPWPWPGPIQISSVLTIRVSRTTVNKIPTGRPYLRRGGQDNPDASRRTHREQTVRESLTVNPFGVGRSLLFLDTKPRQVFDLAGFFLGGARGLEPRTR